MKVLLLESGMMKYVDHILGSLTPRTQNHPRMMPRWVDDNGRPCLVYDEETKTLTMDNHTYSEIKKMLGIRHSETRILIIKWIDENLSHLKIEYFEHDDLWGSHT